MKQLYYIIKFHIGLHLLKQHKLYYVDVWYYYPKLKKECVTTFVAGDLTWRGKQWKRDILQGVSKHKIKITYVHFIDTMI